MRDTTRRVLEAEAATGPEDLRELPDVVAIEAERGGVGLVPPSGLRRAEGGAWIVTTDEWIVADDTAAFDRKEVR